MLPILRSKLAIAYFLYPLENMAVCSVVKAELFYGALRSKNPTRTLERQQEFLRRFASLPFGDEAAIACGQICARLASAVTPIGAYDLQIALANNLTLLTYSPVTGNFARIGRGSQFVGKE